MDNNSNFINSLLSLQLMPRPFGFTWSREQMTNFLKERGYNIIEKKNMKGEKISLAVKKDCLEFPKTEISNILDTFLKEVQEIILNWLLKIGKDETKQR